MENLNTAIDQLIQIEGSKPTAMNGVGQWRILEWQQLESTNTTALRALKHSQRGVWDRVVITAKRQTAGRGQQKRPWTQANSCDLAMTLIMESSLPATVPFSLNLAVSLAVLQATETVLPKLRGKDIEIKWPNDIMWKGRKAGGILIENSWRGNTWASSVIGVGINLYGTPRYPNAISLEDNLESHSGVAAIRSRLLETIPVILDARLAELDHPEALLRQYHERLHGWGQPQRWQLDGVEVRGILESIDLDGRLCVNQNGVAHCFSTGEVGWLGMEPNH